MIGKALLLSVAIALLGAGRAAADEGSSAATNKATPDAAPEAGAPAPEERWSSFLPILAEEARKRGIAMPLPFGVGTTLTVLGNRDIEVDDLRIGVDGGPRQSVSQFVDLGSKSDVFNANLKLDVWILPFLNVYALFGYVYNESDTRIFVTVPRPPILGGGTFEGRVRVKTQLDGFVGGGGLTIAGGYGPFFMVADGNYSQTDMGFDDRFRAVVASLRAGAQYKAADMNVQTWLGTSYWGTANTAKGHTTASDGTRIDFEADQGPKTPWFMDIGSNVRVHEHFEMAFDVGVDFRGGFALSLVPVLRF